MRGYFRIEEIHNRNTKPWYVVLESALDERRRDGDLPVFLLPQGEEGTLSFSCYVDLDQALTAYPKTISEVSGVPQTIIEK